MAYHRLDLMIAMSQDKEPMKVLLVSNEFTRPGRIGNPILCRLQKALQRCDKIDSVDFVPFRNSLTSFWKIRSAAKKVDIIHIQFGGMYAFLVWFCLIGIFKPKLLTFHGTDIHAKEIRTTKSFLTKLKIWLNQKASFCSFFMFDKLGFVSDTLLNYVPNWIKSLCGKNLFLQPLGVDYDLFQPMDKDEACKKLGIERKKYVLFSDKSNTTLKRRDIATNIVSELKMGYDLLLMCGVSPDLVPVYINASDFVLLTSDEEGSPNIVREALSLNKRVFSVDVGDVKQQISGLNNSSIISRIPEEAVDTIKKKLSNPYVDNTRETLQNKIDFNKIANSLVSVYTESLTSNV